MFTETNIYYLKDQIRTKKSQEIKNYNVYKSRNQIKIKYKNNLKECKFRNDKKILIKKKTTAYFLLKAKKKLSLNNKNKNKG
jgi:hypothetical protein